jgi:ubiquitin carboxyl-terminal hydrolase 4/11/15
VLEWEPEVLSLFFGKEDADGPSALWEEYEIFTDPNNPVSKGAKGERELSLEQCLVEFTKEEQLGEDNMWYCPDCKKHQQASKKIDLWKVPDFLVFHFKRFSNSRYNRDKLTNYIDFPIEGLDLKEYVEGRKVLDRLKSRRPEGSGDDDDEEPLIYDLYAVDNHYGGMGGG